MLRSATRRALTLLWVSALRSLDLDPSARGVPSNK